jgi:P-type conjugative transfer protein TrbJ
MKRLLISSALGLIALSGAGVPAASAQFGSGIVYDPANHAENIITAAQSVEQIENQIRQLAHEITMLENMARDLENLPDSIARRILDRLARIDELMRRAEGIGYGVEEVEREYEEIYPEDYGTEPPSSDVLVEEARVRWRQSRTAYRQSLLVTAGVVESVRADSETLDELIGSSQSAIGNLQAVQAGNQIGALSAQQLMQMENMMAAHYRAEALERARALAEAERGRARMRSFLGE